MSNSLLQFWPLFALWGLVFLAYLAAVLREVIPALGKMAAQRFCDWAEKRGVWRPHHG